MAGAKNQKAKINEIATKLANTPKSLAFRFSSFALITLVALMPLHAFLTTWAGTALGHRAVWQSWKEVLIALVVVLTVSFWIRDPNRKRLASPLNLAILIFIIIALVATALFQRDGTAAIFGLKTDVEFLVVFMAAQIVATRALKLVLAQALIFSSAAVIGFGVLQVLLLPPDILRYFGYGSATIQPFLQVPGIEQVRIASTLGGPNQLGQFLIIPICLVLSRLINGPKWWHWIFLIAAVFVEFHTYSRSAWIGLAVALVVVAIIELPRWRPHILAAAISVVLIVTAVLFSSGQNGQIQSYLFHGNVTDTTMPNSSREHAESLVNATEEAITHPAGSGLGSAGPASFYDSEPFISENYYLQLAIETGLAGLALFLAIITLTAKALFRLVPKSGSAVALLGALLGISVVNLLLPGWTDSTTALVYWTYAGVVIGAHS